MKISHGLIILALVLFSGCGDDKGGDDKNGSGDNASTVFKSDGSSTVSIATAGDKDTQYLVWATADKDNKTSAVYWMDVASGKKSSIKFNGKVINKLSARGGNRHVVFSSTNVENHWSIETFEIPADGGELSSDPVAIELVDDADKISSLHAGADRFSYAATNNDVKSTVIYTVLYKDLTPVRLARYDISGSYVAMGASGRTCYSLPYDSPNGRIECADLDELTRNTPKETIEEGLGSPTAIAFSNTSSDAYCWVEITNGVSCRINGEESKVQYNMNSFAMTDDRALYISGTNLFFASGDGIVRYNIETKKADLVDSGKVDGYKLVVIGDQLYYVGRSLRHYDDILSADATSTKGSSNDNPGDSGTPSVSLCSSGYEGTWKGSFSYILSETDPPYSRVRQAEINVELKMSCMVDINDQTVMNITYAKIGDDYFGCTDGCTPSTGSVATLPSSKRASKAGEGIMLMLPNGSILGTANMDGELGVAVDKHKMYYEDGHNGDTCPTIDNLDISTWSASSTSGPSFGGDYKLTTTCWSLSKQ